MEGFKREELEGIASGRDFHRELERWPLRGRASLLSLRPGLAARPEEEAVVWQQVACGQVVALIDDSGLARVDCCLLILSSTEVPFLMECALASQAPPSGC